MFYIRQIFEKKWEYNEAVHQIFIDFKKAYDSVGREVLYTILIEFGNPRKLVKLIKMCLKQGDALSPLLFNFALEYAIRRVQIYQNGLKLKGTHQLLTYADDVNMLRGSVHAVKKNTEALLAATKEKGLEVNVIKTKYIVKSRDQNAGRNHSIRIDNTSLQIKTFFLR
jgi:hypothetical protein